MVNESNGLFSFSETFSSEKDNVDPKIKQQQDEIIQQYYKGDFQAVNSLLVPLLVKDPNNAIANFYAGNLQFDGITVPVDYSKALRYYQRAAQSAYPPAQLAVAKFHYFGYGTKEDKKKAKELYYDLYLDGNEIAYDKMCKYFDEYVFEMNDDEKEVFYRFTAEDGDEDALIYLYRKYTDKTYVDEDAAHDTAKKLLALGKERKYLICLHTKDQSLE